MYPKDLFERQKVREICSLINSGIQPLQNIGVQRVLKKDFGLEKVHEFSSHFVTRGLAVLEQSISDKKKFSVTNELTMADLFIAPQLYWCKNNYIDLSVYPKILRVEAAVNDANPLFDNFKLTQN